MDETEAESSASTGSTASGTQETTSADSVGVVASHRGVSADFYTSRPGRRTWER